ncbi:unnamed protein product [Phytophthora fragariaefolia]|uniref:Unnamed protein product n=1 Tax=Phytophthora fragariaefolia TaxID=1490495 RepID=A0A9W6XPB7_9STRA|nr:unnamed protein product [Phytophthora fragariaefolia]
MKRSRTATTVPKDEINLSFSSEESKTEYAQALQDRHDGLYQHAAEALERIIEGDSEKLWVELALTQFQLWEAHVRALHMPSILESVSELKQSRKGDVKSVHAQLLQEAYSTFLIAMEYPNSKSSPELLLALVRLYIEFGSYRGALAVCTLLVEGYPSSPHLNEAIFLSALTASVLGRHRESAQYFQYLAEGQGPSSSFAYRLAAYQFSLLAALQLAHVPGMRALERETYTQAYKALVALPPVLPSEKSAHILYTTSRKNEEQRTLLWCRDVQTWLDLAQRLAGPANAPHLVLLAMREARRRMTAASGGLPGAKLLLEGASLLRTGDNLAAERVFAEALLQQPRDTYYSARHERFLLEICSPSWCAQFALEHKSAARMKVFYRRCRRLTQWRIGVAYVLEQHRNAMAIRIQCAWRGFQARTELVVLREKQRDREAQSNVDMGEQDDRLIELRLNAAARKIQSLLHIARDKRKLRALRARKIEREALLAKFAGRRAELGRLGILRRWRIFVSNQKQERLDAAVRIQRQVRAWRFDMLHQHVLEYHRKQNEAVIIIQGLFRGFRCRQRLRRRRTAEVLIDGHLIFGSRLKGQPRDIVLWSCLLALSRYIRQRDAAAFQLQHWWKHQQKRSRMLCVLGKRAAQRRLLGRLQQSFYNLARSFFRELRAVCNARRVRRHEAATKIQRRLRCWLMRRRYLSTLDRYSVAAQRGEKAARKIALQRARRLFNGWRESALERRRKQHEAACLVQRTFRRHRAQRQARGIMAKKAAQAQLLATAYQKPLERCFRQWEAVALLEKSVLRVRSSSLIGSREITPVSGHRKPDTAPGSKIGKMPTLEEVSS